MKGLSVISNGAIRHSCNTDLYQSISFGNLAISHTNEVVLSDLVFYRTVKWLNAIIKTKTDACSKTFCENVHIKRIGWDKSFLT